MKVTYRLRLNPSPMKLYSGKNLRYLITLFFPNGRVGLLEPSSEVIEYDNNSELWISYSGIEYYQKYTRPEIVNRFTLGIAHLVF